MIELTYFLEEKQEKGLYQVIQSKPGEPWQIVLGNELIGKVEKKQGMWNLRAETEVPAGLLKGIVKLIEQQHFHHLPSDIKMHWEAYLQEVIMLSDLEYMVICKPGICFESFEKLFRTSIGLLIKDEWQILFRVYNAGMSDDFELVANRVFTAK
ncbi:hypothetical protein [Pedobacter foliorum]|uniref:hypothetical protein n=1 Tax=Pedobacter foliorum TaxID=2739058 RepID=UPI00156471F1|nr:hypothetical protein [Pedobacter foliorum]NRF37493.1 hypothetical protein [Pedobacter foliorum]